jgi:UDP-glucose 4-epimerase
MMTNKILVTGGTGYIGSHTVVELQLSGFEVVVADNLSNSRVEIIDQIARITGKRPGFERVDLCDLPALRAFFNAHEGLQGIVHFAALKAVGESVRHPLTYYHNNLVSLMNLLTCMEEQKEVPAFVFSSSCTVYGQPEKLPVNELAPVRQALSPYGNTKQISEEIIEDQCMASTLRAISLRYFNPIGAHESGLIGELPQGEPNNLLPYITQTAIGKLSRLRIFGTDYNTPDGTCIRDYIHVCDLANAHVVALKRLLGRKTESSYEVFNLGTGKGYSVLEVVRAFEKTSGIELPLERAGRRQGDIEQVWADTAYANIKLGWKAGKGLEEMVSSAWKWEQNLAAGLFGDKNLPQS